MTIRRRMGAITWAVLPLLTGCGAVSFTERATNPVIEDYLSADGDREIGTMASVASRRLTILRLADEQGDSARTDRWRRGEFCSEPPPDAMVAAAGRWLAELTGLEDLPAGDAKLTKSIASNMGPLLYRSQGLQWNRDNMAYICVAYMNRRIDRGKYIDLMEKIMTQSRMIIEKEVENMPTINVTIESLTAPQPEQL